jgi:hypothetical protein
MRKVKLVYTSLADFHCGNDAAGNMAVFLLEKTGSIFGKWSGRLSAADQRKLFGKFIGKGILVINGENETVNHEVSVCFGTMYDIVSTDHWRELSAMTLNAGVAA